MCRLYTDMTTHESIVALNRTFGQIEPGEYEAAAPAKSFAIRTTDMGRVIRRQDGGWRVDAMRWGLVPFWAKELKFGVQCVDARSDTIAEKPAFREAFKQRRCLVPASSWVEWREETVEGEKKPIKQPYRIELGNGAPILFAGLWESWRQKQPDGTSAEPVLSYAIATCDPSPYAAQIHDRMPVLVEPENAEAWCSAPAAEAQQLLRGYTGPLVARPIHRDIAVAKKATAASIEAIGPAIA
jgi:putative SOS response-associated peptidase YedK